MSDDNRSQKSSGKSAKSNVSHRSRRSIRDWKNPTPEPVFKSVPLKQKIEEDPDDPIVQKLEKLRIEMQKKEMLRKIDAAENAKMSKMKMRIESVGGGSAQK